MFMGPWALRWIFGLILLTVSWVTRPIQNKDRKTFTWPGFVGLGVGLLVGLGSSLGFADTRIGGWLSVIALVGLVEGERQLLARQRHWAIRGLLILVFGFLAAAIVGALAQIESKFAHEEFFAILDVIVLGVFFSSISASSDLSEHIWGRLTFKGLQMKANWVLGASLLLLVIGMLIGVRAYQRSFYSTDVPTYVGIDSGSPFLCGEAYEMPSASPFESKGIFSDIVELLEEQPFETPPKFGMLALLTEESYWADIFRTTLIREAENGFFTEPAHSVKWGQYEASRRLYFYIKVRDAFPDLFSVEDRDLLAEWFSNINRRALTVEWVDWLYGLVFSKWPEGPYENQENGAGLLSLLEYSGLAAPELSDENRAYLEREPRGWQARFRNTDDAYTYQSIWIENAYYQSLLEPNVSERNRQLSFDWLLLQALPNGKQLSYNSSGSLPLASPAYLGAGLLTDPHLMWLAGSSLDVVAQEDEAIAAFPGILGPLNLSGQAPGAGSCLLYSQSGLPNQIGPLAPDKLVLRDGWLPDSKYLLLNLRFSGWHRYKATNTVTMMYKQGVVVKDSSNAEATDWLPEGRSLFRDKRVPRENLNGLLIERSGMDAVVQTLSGLGGRWAQDPPHYAEVLDFQTSAIMDYAHTRVDGWHGWTHDREIYFYHPEDVIGVLDTASGPSSGFSGRHAALAWQAVTPPVYGERTVLLNSNVRLIVLNADGDVVAPVADDSDRRLIYLAGKKGELNLISLFLFDEWADESVRVSISDSSLIIERAVGSMLEIPIASWAE